MTNTKQRAFGNVRQLPSGRFQARWKGPDGHFHNAPQTFSTREAAKIWLAGERTARARGEWIDERVSGEPFVDAAETWRARRLGAGYRVATWTRDVEYLDRYVMPRWRDTALDEIGAEAIEAWYQELVASGGKDGAPLAAASVHKIGQIFSGVLSAAVRGNKLLANPAKGVPLPRDPDPAEMKIITPSQIEELAEAIDPRWATWVLTGCYTGLRVGELLALRARDVDLDERRIFVRRIVVEVNGKNNVGAPKTKAGLRTVPFPRALKGVLSAQVAACGHPDELLFPNTGGNYQGLSSLRSRFWVPATVKAGLPGLRIHDMRHTAISLWLAGGIDAKKIAEWAGHRSVATVLDRYAHPYEDDDPMGGVDELLRKARPRGAGTVTPIR